MAFYKEDSLSGMRIEEFPILLEQLKTALIERQSARFGCEVIGQPEWINPDLLLDFSEWDRCPPHGARTGGLYGLTFFWNVLTDAFGALFPRGGAGLQPNYWVRPDFSGPDVFSDSAVYNNAKEVLADGVYGSDWLPYGSDLPPTKKEEYLPWLQLIEAIKKLYIVKILTDDVEGPYTCHSKFRENWIQIPEYPASADDVRLAWRDFIDHGH